ncbi:MAG: hypothetical protein COW89_06980 [Nitrospinae bacterium CG22_combo_CG10-13_8_21_14_all_47_10]|nr:MAG: hypothetical protein COW89_06980 [Nitrospinae bacterium CG22_combo_CG10-13_8_21_14_all_47_10]
MFRKKGVPILALLSGKLKNLMRGYYNSAGVPVKAENLRWQIAIILLCGLSVERANLSSIQWIWRFFCRLPFFRLPGFAQPFIIISQKSCAYRYQVLYQIIIPLKTNNRIFCLHSEIADIRQPYFRRHRGRAVVAV